MDNGKVKLYLRDGIPVAEIYHDGELNLTDVIWMNHTILNELEHPINSPTDLIVDCIGSYSFSNDAFMAINKLMQDSDRVAYVIHHPHQKVIINLAIKVCLSRHEVRKFNVLDDAFEWMLSS